MFKIFWFYALDPSTAIYINTTDQFEYSVARSRTVMARGNITGWNIQRKSDGIILAQSKELTK